MRLITFCSSISLCTIVQMCTPVQAQTATWAIDPDHTHVHWEVSHFGTSTHRGRFDDVRGRIDWDRTANQAEVSIVVGTASVNTGGAVLDGVLRSSKFLSSDGSPDAYFVARQWRVGADGLPEMRGEFTLRGISQPLSLKATLFGCRQQDSREVCGGDFEGELSRSEFGITFGLPFIGDRVRLLVQVEAVRQAP
jgi:polyisoprenoid-binding protein YceI